MTQRKNTRGQSSLEVRADGKLGLLGIVLLFLFLTGHSSVVAQSWFLTAHVRAAGVVMPIYPDNGLKPLVIVRADRVYEDYQRKGFFRIGMLPMFVFEGLHLELCDTNQLAAALISSSGQFRPKGKAGSPVEARNFSVSFSGQTNGVIHARIVRLEDAKQWRLLEGTVDQSGATSIPFRQAILTIAGPESGELNYETEDGRKRVHLLSLAFEKDQEPTKP